MQRCLALAELGLGFTAPNPLVGAVLVHKGIIIGEGYHQKYGEAHAEVNCIEDAEKNLPGTSDQEQIFSESTMYVSLEPCTHFGKTPPCADLLIRKKIKTVIIGSTDPFHEVNGKGVKKLRAAGVTVESGILEEACNDVNKRFICFQQKKRPYIILKWAQTCDGFIGKNGHGGISISNRLSNRLVHKWRSEESAILVGTNTALADDPKLTTRLWPGSNPTRIILDMNLRLPDNLNLFDDTTATFVFNATKETSHGGLKFVKIDSRDVIGCILQKLYEMNIQSVLVEGGAITLQSFIDAGLWDEARVITNVGLRFGDGVSIPVLSNEKLTANLSLEEDIVQFFTRTINVDVPQERLS